MWGAECQSHWEAAIDSGCALPAPWIQASGAGALEEAAISLPGGWHWTAEPCPFTCQRCPLLVEPACQTGSKGALQQGSVLFAGDCFSDRERMIILPLGWFIILEFFSCWFYELLNWYLDSLILRRIDAMGHCLYLYLSTFEHWTPGGFG